MPRISHEQMPVAALERAALGGALATNRWPQPEILGRSGSTRAPGRPATPPAAAAFDRLGAPERSRSPA